VFRALTTSGQTARTNSGNTFPLGPSSTNVARSVSGVGVGLISITTLPDRSASNGSCAAG